MTEEDSQDPMPPRPGAEHRDLLKKVGEWEVKCSYYFDPSGEPLEVKGIDRVEAIGEFWTVGHFTAEIPGSTVHGVSTTGYDPAQGIYVGTWFDSTNPYFYHFSGHRSEDGKILEMTGMNIDPQTGELARYRSVEEHLSHDRRTLALYLGAGRDEGGKVKEVKILFYEYKRKTGRAS